MLFAFIIDAVLLFAVALSGICCARLYFCGNNMHSFNCLCLTNTREVMFQQFNSVNARADFYFALFLSH